MREDSDKSFASLTEEERGEYWAALALIHCRGLGPRNRAKLLSYYPSARAAIDNCKGWNSLGIPGRAIDAMKNASWRQGARQEWEAAKKLNCRILLRTDKLFPPRLVELVDAPVRLYFSGDLHLLSGPCVAIVGSRNASERSLAVAKSLAASLSACGITVVSGMACGIDTRAHDGALDNIGKSVGVLGTGIEMEYPGSNKPLYQKMRLQGLLISEFAPGSPPVAYNFPIRNRIISGLSLGVVVVEAAARSGSLVTARLALEQNREVFAVPGQALDSQSLGCQNLVREGAHPVFDVDDILRNLDAPLRKYRIIPEAAPVASAIRTCEKKLKAAPSPEEESGDAVRAKEIAREKVGDGERVLACLRKSGPMHIDAIAKGTGIPSGQLASLLTFMEMLGQIKRHAGARFEAAN